MPSPETIKEATRLAHRLIAAQAAVEATTTEFDRIAPQYHEPVPGKPEHGIRAMRRVLTRLEKCEQAGKDAQAKLDAVVAEVSAFAWPVKANKERREARKLLWEETIRDVRARRAGFKPEPETSYTKQIGNHNRFTY